MSFPSSATHNQLITVNGIVYIYSSANNTWTKYSQTHANIITTDTANIISTTSSTSTTTGALKVAGGAGIQGNVFAEAVYTNSYFYANGTALSGTIGFTGSAVTGFSGSTGYTGSASPGGSGDQYINSVSLLLHFDGTNGATRTYDSSVEKVPITFGSAASLSSTQAKFGTTSLATTTSSNSSVYTTSVTSNGPLDLSTGNPNWTVEAWAYPTALPSGTNEFNGFVLFWGPAGFAAGFSQIGLLLQSGGKWAGQFNSNNTATGDTVIVSSANATLNSWTHLALSRSGNTAYFFVNGVLQNTSNNIANGINFSTNGWQMGQGTNNTYKFSGYIDDVRITKNIARYTSNFTPDNAAFPEYYSGIGYTGSASTVIGFTGSTGSTGFTGSAGAGYTGSAGPQGTTGFTGSTGTTGFTGSIGIGFAGSAGFTGSTGVGFTGSAGTQGAIGYTGSAAAGGIGYTGSAGTPGALASGQATNTFTGDGTTTAFTLSVAPVSVDAVTVNIDGIIQQRTSAYTVSGYILTFSEAPLAGEIIEVTVATYGTTNFVTRTYTGNGTTSNYTVTLGTTVNSVIVTENGVVQTPTTDYTILGNQLTFTSAPAAGTAIVIREIPAGAVGGNSVYSRTAITAIAGQTTFAVAYNIGFLEVYFNGALLNSIDYTATNGSTVILTDAAAAGDILEFITYNVVPVTAVPAATFNSTNLTANLAITAGYSAVSVGPINIANGVTVSIADGQKWVIL